MSEITLLKAPTRFNKDGGPTLYAEQVVGITLPHSPTIMEHGYRLAGDESEEGVDLKDDTAARVGDFFERTRAVEPDKRPFFNCHSFAFYALQRVQRLQRYDHYYGALPSDEHVPNLQSGEAYMVQTSQGVLNHSLLGIDRPTYNLSVLGDYSPLVVSENSDLMSFYEGTKIRHHTPKSAR